MQRRTHLGAGGRAPPLSTHAPLHVVHVITGLGAGGAERVLLDTASRSQHAVTVIALSTEGVVADQLRARGIPVHLLGMHSNRDLRAVVRLTRLLRDLSPDVVHVHLFRSLLYGRLAARLAGLRAVLATEHSALPDSTEGRRATRSVHVMYWLAERLGAVTVAVSATTRDVLVRYWHVSEGRITVVPNGIDTARFRLGADVRARVRAELGLADGQRLLLATGRLVPGKRIDRVIEVLTLLPDDFRLIVVGRGEGWAELVGLVDRLQLSDRVEFIGELSDVAPMYAAADAFVSASVVETYGIALIEAFVAGLPVVYVQSPAADELKQLLDAPRLLHVGEGLDDLAAGIREALAFPVGPEHVPDSVRERVDIGPVSARVDELQAELSRRYGRRRSRPRG